MRKWNFCAGPAAISEDVLLDVKSELLEWKDSGTSIMEMSHRSPEYLSVARDQGGRRPSSVPTRARRGGQ